MLSLCSQASSFFLPFIRNGCVYFQIVFEYESKCVGVFVGMRRPTLKTRGCRGTSNATCTIDMATSTHYALKRQFQQFDERLRL